MAGQSESFKSPSYAHSVGGLHEQVVRQVLEYVNGSVPLATCFAFVQSVVVVAGDATAAKGVDAVLDALWVVDQQLTHTAPQRKALLSDLVKEIWAKKLTSEAVLIERLEPDLLEAAAVIPSASNFTRRTAKINTGTFYKQQKFNLMREETEGFAKLVLELNLEATKPLELQSSSRLYDNVLALIGYFDLDPNRVLDVVLEAFASNHQNAEKLFIDLIKKLKVLSTTLCQLVGFKLQSFQAEGVLKQAPIGLLRMVALILHHRLFELQDIYPHLLPTDEKAAKDYSEAETRVRKASRGLRVVALNKSTTEEGSNSSSAGAASSSPTTKDRDYKSDKDKEKEREKDKTPATPAVVEEPEPTAPVPPSADVNDPMYPVLFGNQKLQLIQALLEVGDRKRASMLIDRMPANLPASFEAISKVMCSHLHQMIAPLYLPFSPRAKFGAGLQEFQGKALSYEWPSHVPVQTVSTFEDFLKGSNGVFPLLLALGPFIGRDPILQTKVARVVKAFIEKLKNEKSTSYSTHMGEMVRVVGTCLLPSLGLLPNNPGQVLQLWEVVQLLPYHIRYRLYFEWRTVVQDSNPVMALVKANTANDIRKILRRLSSDNVKLYSRQMGKVSHSNPAVVFGIILEQLQAYDNLVIPVVDAFKYITPFGFDILAYSIIEALSSPDKPRLKEDGTNIASWLNGLAVFTGTVYKKYPGIELAGILNYISNQLKNHNTYDLVILKELVQKMAGFTSNVDIPLSQLESQAGGQTLRTEGGTYDQVRNVKKSSQRLLAALQEEKLAFPLFVLIAQQQMSALFDENVSNLKMISGLYDQCQETLAQYSDFLMTTAEPQAYDAMIPPLAKLLQVYQLDPSQAFSIARPKFAYLLSSETAGTFETGEMPQGHTYASYGMLRTLAEDVEKVLPAATFEGCSPLFYVIFWQLSLYDIYIPTERYKEQIAKQKEAIAALDSDRTMDATKRRKEQERCKGVIEKLLSEMGEQQVNNNFVLAMLNAEKDKWFEGKGRTEVVVGFIQHCIFPRCVLSPTDAVYCARFILLLHTIGAFNFSSLFTYDKAVSDISFAVFSCTEDEAKNYGRFLEELLSQTNRWFLNEAVYKKDAIEAGVPGFAKRWSTVKTLPSDILSYTDFRNVYLKWEIKLKNALSKCLESKEYMQTRNALLVLMKIINYFPVTKYTGNYVKTRVNAIVADDKDTRKDLQMIARRCHHELESREAANWKFDDLLDKFQPGIIAKPEAAAAVPPAGAATSNKDESAGTDAKPKRPLVPAASSTNRDRDGKDRERDRDRSDRDRSDRDRDRPSSSSSSSKSDAPKSSSSSSSSSRSSDTKVSSKPKDVKEIKDVKEGKDSKDRDKDGKDTKDRDKDGKDAKEKDSKDSKDAKEKDRDSKDDKDRDRPRSSKKDDAPLAPTKRKDETTRKDADSKERELREQLIDSNKRRKIAAEDFVEKRPPASNGDSAPTPKRPVSTLQDDDEDKDKVKADSSSKEDETVNKRRRSNSGSASTRR